MVGILHVTSFSECHKKVDYMKTALLTKYTFPVVTGFL